MLTISDVAKSFGGRTLFENVSLQVNKGDRVGLVGPNGAGKTTLFSMILGAEEPDTGSINLQRGSSVGFLPQESAPVGSETVIQLATAMNISLESMKPKSGLGAEPENSIEDEHAWEAELSEPGGFEVESKAKKILKGLGFKDKDFDRAARELSGGWVMRAHLARLLVQEPDLLILDEPTNHLDLEALLWFQNYLTGYPGAILMISHDREFLNALVDSILEIRKGNLYRYRGNYEDYLAQKAAKEEQQLAAYKNQQREIAHMMDFVNRFRAKNTKAAQAQSKLKQIERMEKIEPPESEDRKIKFSFPQPQRSGQRVITLKGVHHAYGANVVYSGIDFQAERGQRIVLVGPNGAGKSTLLKLLAGVMPVQQGERELGHNAKSGYFAQYRVENLNPSNTVFEEASDTPQRVTEEFIRTILGSFLFRGDDIYKKVSVLSGGEKSRLALIKLLLDPPNLLLMDEPTTHLDMASIDALIQALHQYEGTLIFISHDVYFIRSIAKHVVHVNAGRLTPYAGDYQYYLDKTSPTSARAGLTAGTINQPQRPAPPSQEDRSAAKSKEQKRLEAEQRQARSKGRKDQQTKVHQIEKRVAELEKKQAELTVELEKPETYSAPGRAMQVNRELADIVDKLESLTAEWEAEAAILTSMDEK